MSVREAIQIGDPRLKAKNKAIKKFDSKKLSQLIDDLTDTMRSKELVGMAAPQIGENYKVLITEPRVTKTRTTEQSDELRVYINPEIIYYSKDETIIFEGCGSVMNGQLFGPVKRPKEIIISASDQKGRQFELKCDGLLARVIQHEYDHLFGIEFTEKIIDYKRLMNIDFYIKNIKNSEEQMANSVITIKEYKMLDVMVRFPSP